MNFPAGSELEGWYCPVSPFARRSAKEADIFDFRFAIFEFGNRGERRLAVADRWSVLGLAEGFS